MWFNWSVEKELIKDGPYYIYKGIRIFKKKGGFSYVYATILPDGNYKFGDTYPKALKEAIKDIDHWIDVYPLAVIENYRLKLIKEGN